MAARQSRPGRTLLVLLLVTAGLFAAVAAIGTWKPRLGLDLQGGQRITLQAKAAGGGGVTESKLNQAADIISSRVNGAGVSEAEVSTQGSDIILVEVPGKPDENLVRSVGTTAQLRFRLVEGVLPAPGQAPTPSTPTPGSPATPGPSESPSPSGSTPSVQPGGGDTSTPSGSSPTKQRPVADWFRSHRATADRPSTDGDKPGGPTPTTPPPGLTPPDLEDIPDPLNWQPSAEWQQKLQNFTCPEKGKASEAQPDLPSQPLLACDSDGNRYLLGPALIEGTSVNDANAGIPQGQAEWVVTLDFDGDGAKKFAEVTNHTKQNGGTGQQVAIVLDGQVLSAPTNQQAITGGNAEISGNFTQDSAQSLANSLKYGALPLTFTIQSVTNEGPELASNQLDAGVLAGLIGLLLVVIYCLLYYRALGVVVIASLAIAGALTYACVLLLGHAYGFTLTLPGIAGLIVAIGITADSFIVYFERLRDEVREGKTLRTSVETGWARARNTILAADGVSFLAALVLYIFAIGVVKGFAFALGLTTLIDVFVVFFFTKPLVTFLSRTTFFGHGHKLSGFDRAHLGLPPLQRKPRTVGGEV